MHVDLLELPYFEGITMDHLVSLVDLMKPAQFSPGEFIVHEGDPVVPPLYIATSGRVLITKKNPEGQARHLAQLSAPTLFGEIELFCQVSPVCSAQALERVAAFALDRPTFDQLYADRHPGVLAFTFNMAKVACHRLAIADEMLTRVLADEDLIHLRQTVWSKIAGPESLPTATGAFRRPR